MQNESAAMVTEIGRATAGGEIKGIWGESAESTYPWR